MRSAEPSERNYAIFAAVEFAGESLRKVAAEHAISPTRVQQIVEQTRIWFASTTGRWLRELPPYLQLFVACRLENIRLEHLYNEAMEAWRNSAGMETITRESHQGQHTTTSITRRGHGDPRYLATALRVIRAKLDNAARCATLAREHSEAIDRILSEQVYTPPATPCAPEEEGPAEPPRSRDGEPTLSDEIASLYEQEFFAEMKAQQLTAPPPNPVRNRKERKRRAKELRQFQAAQRLAHG